MANKIFDNNGNELFIVTINTICPIDKLVEAKKIAHIHMTKIEGAKDDKLEHMLPKRLGPINEDKITHAFCARHAFTASVEKELNTLSSTELDWCGTKEYTLNDSPEEIKSKFCCITGDTAKLLEHLQLEYK